jgi:dihydrofolate reductase
VRISLIVAMARNGVIGQGNALPWRLPADLKRFKALTMGHPVIMGRKTHESIGRPLPGRTNIVLTRLPGYAAPGCIVAGSTAAALAACGGADQAFVIGGAEIYRAFLDRADRLDVTEIDADVPGDTVFPAYDRAQWRECARQAPAEAGGDPALPFAFVTYDRLTR